MNRFLLGLALLLFGFAPLLADPNIPGGAWEQHTEGVALAIVFTVTTENGTEKGTIKVYIKNTSGTTKYLPGNINDRAVQIFYIDNEGRCVPLRDYSLKVPPIFTMPAMPDSRLYQAGELGIRTVDLSPTELALVKKYPVQCRFHISDSKIGGYKLIESSLKILVAGP
jgi:hypothetical protein